ncbi:MAG: serine/threonine-protein kinase [Planctomycetota bacterium]|jgi:hypothetical protein|nr:serine/threonine-protein kinase [Planctomycetota bacterium]
MSLHPSWQRLCEQDGDPRATIGQRTVLITDTTPTCIPGTDSETAATAGRAFADNCNATPQTRYRQIAALGRGGMGEVLLVEQTSLGRSIALKTLRDDRRDHDLAAAFTAETRITASLEHPGVVPVHDAGIDYLAMKLVEGQTLESIIQARKRWDDQLGDLIDILLRVIESLAYAHQRGILHRDLKPGNIMVGAFGEVYLMDWGLALACGDAPPDLPHITTANNIFAGSPAYLPPEVARGERDSMGPASDAFGIGAILFEILSGGPPFPGNTIYASMAKAARGECANLPTTVSEYHADLAACCTGLLAPEPEQRSTLIQCRRELRAWLENSERRARAQQHHAAAQRAFDRASLATASGQIYRLLADCAAECERAIALDAQRNASHTLRRDAHRCFAAEAIRIGDFTLARCVLDEDDDPALNPMRNALANAVAKRELRAARGAAAARWSARLAAAVALLIILTGGYQWYERRGNVRDRRAQAMALLSQTAPDARSKVHHALQALGLHDQPQAVTPALFAASTEAIRAAISQQRLDLAQSHLALAQQHGLDAGTVNALTGTPEQAGTIAHLAAAPQRERTRRNERVAAISQQAAGRHLPAQWLQHRVAELSAWDAPDPETAEQTGRLFAKLLHHEDPLLRMLGLQLRSALRADPSRAAILAEQTPQLQLIPSDPDQRVQALRIAAVASESPKNYLSVIEAVLALDTAAQQRALGETLNSDLAAPRSAAIERYVADPHITDLGPIISQYRFLLAIKRVGSAHSLRRYWDDRLGERYRPMLVANGRNQSETALAQARAILAREATTVAFSHAAHALIALKRFDELAALLEDWRQRGTQHYSALPYQAVLDQHQGRHEQAARAAYAATDAFVRNMDFPHITLVHLMMMLPDFDLEDQATLIAHAIARSAPNSPRSINNIGWTHHQAKRYPQALHYTTLARERDPGSWLPWALRTEVMLATKRYNEAFSAANHSIAQGGGKLNRIYVLRSRAQIALGNIDQGLVDLEQAFALSENPRTVPDILFGITQARRHGKHEVAARLTEQLKQRGQNAQRWHREQVRNTLAARDLATALALCESQPWPESIASLWDCHPRGPELRPDHLPTPSDEHGLPILEWTAAQSAALHQLSQQQAAPNSP